MEKIGVVSIYDLNNYGNRLQNYALFKVLEKEKFKVKVFIENN